MIVFDLKCKNNHTFEGWFDDNDAFEKQQKDGLLECPICSTQQVVKIFSPFAIKGSTLPSADQPSQKDFARLGRQIIEYVKDNTDDVGSDFTKEALKIHYGVSEPRSIRGVSTPNEEKMLKEEGIDFLKIPIPVLPSESDQNDDST